MVIGSCVMRTSLSATRSGWAADRTADRSARQPLRRASEPVYRQRQVPPGPPLVGTSPERVAGQAAVRRSRPRPAAARKRLLQWSSRVSSRLMAFVRIPPVKRITTVARRPARATSLSVCQSADAGGVPAGRSCRVSAGARMNTSHIISGCCWLPLMKPITRRPVARPITASKRSCISC
jgi:hypothetical protein